MYLFYMGGTYKLLEIEQFVETKSYYFIPIERTLYFDKYFPSAYAFNPSSYAKNSTTHMAFQCQESADYNQKYFF